MGGNKKFWFTDTPIDSNSTTGISLRQSILDGTITDLEKAGIPARFRPVVEAFKRVQGAKSDLYNGLLEAITQEEWTHKLATTKKGTAPGLSRETIDMLASLSSSASSMLRRIVNLALRSQRVFTKWLHRAICPIPKVPGNPDVKLSRPLTLLSVSGKVFWAIMTDRVTRVWRENHLLQPQQYGFQQERSTDEPLIISTLAAEQCYDFEQPLITISQDISKAFDSVSRSFKSLALGRLGVPDEFCEMFASMDEGNQTVVLTAYGTSAEVLGDIGTFECLRGYAQGCTSSASMGWNSAYDVLLSMQNSIGTDGGTFNVLGDENGECDRSTLAYADDALYLSGGACTASPRRSAELKLAIGSLFFDFMGITFNASKTLCCAMEFPEMSGEYTSVAEDGDWCPWTYDLDVIFAGGALNLLSETSAGGADHICDQKHRVKSIKMIPVADGYRYLGIQSSPRLDTEISKKIIEEIVDEITERIRNVPVGGNETRFLLEQVLWAKIGYKLRFDRFAIDSFKNAERRVRELFLHRGSRLNVRINKDIAALPPSLGGPGVTIWRDIIMADRLRLVQRHLDNNTTAAPSIRAAITRCQEKYGSKTPVFETQHGWKWLESDSAEHGWIEALAVWCSEHKIQLHGGATLPGAAHMDASVIDLATSVEDKQLLQRACHQMDQHWASDYLLLDGHTINIKAVHHDTKYRTKICRILTNLLQRWEATPMPRYDGNAIKAGDVMFVKSDIGIQLIEVSSVSGSQVRAYVLDAASVSNKKEINACRIGDRVYARRKQNCPWQPGTIIARPQQQRIVVQRPSGIVDERIYLNKPNTVRVFTTTTKVWHTDDPWTNGDTSLLWTKSNKTLRCNVSRAIRLPIQRCECSAFFTILITPTEFLKIADTLHPRTDDHGPETSTLSTSRSDCTLTNALETESLTHGDAKTPRPNSCINSDSIHSETLTDNINTTNLPIWLRQANGASCAAVTSDRCDWPDGIDALRTANTLIASDGGYDHLDSGSWGLVVCSTNKVECFAGKVDGGVGTNSSYRSETYGLCAGLQYAYWTQTPGHIKHILDNKAVVRVFQDCETRGSRLTCSQDVWDEIIWYKKPLGTDTQ